MTLMLQGVFDGIPGPIDGRHVRVLAARRAERPGAGQGKARPRGADGRQSREKAPKFTLKDQEGKERPLDDLLKKGNVALVFYRSADW